ncbi:MAG: hypothetical protein IIV48_04205 [Clostridium sp.]|nr:hypothetical protein [Clostridium sp.]
MKKFKSHKIKETINKSNEDLNLHEIKAKTGAGNGYKHSYTKDIEVSDEISNSSMFHKSHKIQDVIDEHDGDLNLHEIKAKTGAGNGYKHHTTDIEVADELNNSQPIHKSHKIQDVIDEHDGHLNLHQIKAKTGAGSGHKHHTTDIEVADELSNSQPIHKSHKIQDVIDEHDGHLNLHQIKTKTGAGSGHKH